MKMKRDSEFVGERNGSESQEERDVAEVARWKKQGMGWEGVESWKQDQ